MPSLRPLPGNYVRLEEVDPPSIPEIDEVQEEILGELGLEKRELKDKLKKFHYVKNLELVNDSLHSIADLCYVGICIYFGLRGKSLELLG